MVLHNEHLFKVGDVVTPAGNWSWGDTILTGVGDVTGVSPSAVHVGWRTFPGAPNLRYRSAACQQYPWSDQTKVDIVHLNPETTLQQQNLLLLGRKYEKLPLEENSAFGRIPG